MITLDQARELIGHPVEYQPPFGPAGHGVITRVQHGFVYVRYTGYGYAKATDPKLLTLEDQR